jgi:hypothetical protein
LAGLETEPRPADGVAPLCARCGTLQAGGNAVGWPGDGAAGSGRSKEGEGPTERRWPAAGWSSACRGGQAMAQGAGAAAQREKNRQRLRSAFRRRWQARRHRGRDSGWPYGRCGQLARCMRPCVLRHGALRRVAGRGVLGRGARAQGRGGGPTEVQVHRGDDEASVRRRNQGMTRGRRGCARARARP